MQFVKPENTPKKGIEREDNFTFFFPEDLGERERERDPSQEQLWRKKEAQEKIFFSWRKEAKQQIADRTKCSNA
jgi:hypothetical protein